MLFDTHAHYDDDKFNDDRHNVIKKARESGIGYILNAANDAASSAECISLSREFDFVYAAVGVHPHNVEHMNDNTLSELADLAGNEKVVAIGEIGLDYYYNNSPAEKQKLWFARQINLARRLKLPVIVHDRDAHEDVLKILTDENAKDVGGVLHCYSGSVEMAKILLKRNFYISVGGAVTFKNARRIIEVVEYLPLDRLLLETDCPYMTPEPHRGKRNDSSYLKYISARVADIKSMPQEEIINITTENAKRLFKIK